MAETIQLGGRSIAVREVARPEGWLCRVLVAEDGGAYLEYVVSVGPYKIDVAKVHPLGREEFAAFEAGRFDLAVLARALAERDEASRVPPEAVALLALIPRW